MSHTTKHNKDLEEILGQLAGAASLCWEPKPTGVFDPVEATDFIKEAEAKINRHYLAKQDVEKAIPRKKNHKSLSSPTAEYQFDKGYDQAIDDIRQSLGLNKETK